MPSSQLISPLVQALHNSGRLRVWSLVITIFGDAVQPRGGTVATADLVAIAGCAGIEPGGLRTAVSRLLKEGWLESEKQGRNSFYRLSSRGVAEFVSATKRIYALPDQMPKKNGFLLAVAPPDSTGAGGIANQLSSMGGLDLGNKAFLWHGENMPDMDKFKKLNCLISSDVIEPIPDWTRQLIAPKELTEGYLALEELLDQMLKNIEEMPLPDPLSSLTGRILLIHQWRKLVLRTPELPSDLFPDDWPGTRCANKVGKIYHHLLEQSENYWDQADGVSHGSALTSRFQS